MKKNELFVHHSVGRIKKILKGTLKITGVIIVLLIIYAIAALTLYRIPVNKNVNYTAPNDVTIYLLSSGVHTDVVVPVKNEIMDWSRFIKFEDTDCKDSSYQFVGIGWGDKGFFLQTPEWKDLKLSVALKAGLHLSTAAIHATFHHTIDTLIEKSAVLHISNEAYKNLANYIINSFDLDPQGNSIHIPSTNDGYGNNDAFYEAKSSYSLFYTCNTWSNNALKAAKQKASFWTLLDKGIFYHYPKS